MKKFLQTPSTGSAVKGKKVVKVIQTTHVALP